MSHTPRRLRRKPTRGIPFALRFNKSPYITADEADTIRAHIRLCQRRDQPLILASDVDVIRLDGDA